MASAAELEIMFKAQGLDKVQSSVKSASGDMTKGFDAGAASVEKAAVKAGALKQAMSGFDFGGEKIAAQAKDMAAGIEKVGGASKLTAKELAQVKSTTDEAVAKFKALGKDVPPDLQKLAAEVDKVESETKTVGDTAKKSFGGMEVAAIAAGAAIGTAVTAGIGVALGALNSAGGAVTGFFKDAISEASAFDNKMREVMTLGADPTAMLGPISDEVNALSTRMGIDAVDAANAMYNTISAGAPSAEAAMQIVEKAAMLGIAGVTDTDTAARALMRTMNAWQLDASELNSVMDTFFGGMKSGVTTVPQLAEGIGIVAGQAANLGISYQDTIGLISATTKQGAVDTSVAYTQMAAAMTAITKGAGPEMEAVLGQLGAAKGVDAHDTKALIAAYGGFDHLLEAVRQTADASGISLEVLFGRVEGAKFTTALTNDQFRNTQAVLDSVNSAAGSTAEGFAIMNEGFTRKVELMRSAADGLKYEIGKQLLPGFGELADGVSDAVGRMASRFAEMDMSGITEMFGGLTDTLAEVNWEEVADQIVDLVENGIAKLKDFDWVTFGEDVKTGLGGLSEIVSSVITVLDILGETNKKVDDATGGHGKAVGLLLLDYGTWWGVLKDVGSELGRLNDADYWQDVAAASKGLVSGVAEDFDGMGEKVASATATLQTDTAAAWSSLQSDITSAANDIGSRVQGAFEGMRVAVSGVQATLSAWLTGAWESLRAALDSAVTAIHTRITEVWTAVANATSAAWAYVYNTAMRYAAGLVNGIRNAMQWIWDRVSQAWTAVANATLKAWLWIRDKVEAGLQAVSRGISSAFQWIHNKVIVPVWTKIASVVGKAWSWIVEKTGAALTAVHNAVHNAFGAIGKRIGDVMGKVAGAVRRAFSGFLDNIRGFAKALQGVPGIGEMLGGITGLGGEGGNVADKIAQELDGINDVPASAADVLGANFHDYQTTLEEGLADLGDLPAIEPPTFSPVGGGGGAGSEQFEIGGMYSDKSGDYTFNELGEKVYTSGVGLAKQNAKAAKDAESAAKAASKAGAAGIKKGAAEGAKEKAAADLAGMFAGAVAAGLAAIEELMAKSLPDIERIKERLGTLEQFFTEVGHALVRTIDAIGVDALVRVDEAIESLGGSLNIVAGAAQAMSSLTDVKAVGADKLAAVETFLQDAGAMAQRLATTVKAEDAEALQAIAQTLSTWVQAIGGAASALSGIADMVIPASIGQSFAKITDLMDAVVEYSGGLVAKAQAAIPESGDLLDVMVASEAIAGTFQAWAGAIADIASASTALAGAKSVTAEAVANLESLMDNVARITGGFVTAVQSGIADPGDQTAMLDLSQAIAGTFAAWAKGLTELVNLSVVLNQTKTVADSAWSDMQAAMDGVARLTGGFVIALEKAVPDATERMQSLQLSQAIGATFAGWIGALVGIVDLTGKLAEIRGVPVSAFETVQGVMNELSKILRSLIMGDGWDLTKDIPAATAAQGLLQTVVSTVGGAVGMVSAVVDMMTKLTEIPEIPADAIKRVGANLSAAFKEIQQLSETWRGDKTDAELSAILAGIKAYADGAGAAIKLLSSAAAVTIEWEKMSIIPARFLRYVGANVANMLDEVRNIAAEFINRGMTDPGAAENASIVDGLKAFVAVAGASIDILVKAAGITTEWQEITHSISSRRLRYVGASIAKMLDEMERIAAEFIDRGYTDEGAAANSALVTSVNAFVSVAGAAIDSFSKVGEMIGTFADLTHSISSRRLRYVGASIAKMFDEIKAVTEGLVNKHGTDSMKALGDTVDLVLGPFEAFADAIGSLNEIENVRMLTEAQVAVARNNFLLIIGALFGDPTTGDGGFIQDISADIAAAKTRTVELVGVTAESLGKVTDVMGAFMENPFMKAKSMRGGGWKLMDWKSGPLEAMKERIRMAIRETVLALTDAFNDSEVQTALDSIDEALVDKLSKLADAYSALADVMERFNGVSVPDMTPMANALLQLMRPLSSAGFTGGGGGGGESPAPAPGNSQGGDTVINLTTHVELAGQTLETLFSKIYAAESRGIVMEMPAGG